MWVLSPIISHVSVTCSAVMDMAIDRCIMTWYTVKTQEGTQLQPLSKALPLLCMWLFNTNNDKFDSKIQILYQGRRKSHFLFNMFSKLDQVLYASAEVSLITIATTISIQLSVACLLTLTKVNSESLLEHIFFNFHPETQHHVKI